jgi:hypothetical protein
MSDPSRLADDPGLKTLFEAERAELTPRDDAAIEERVIARLRDPGAGPGPSGGGTSALPIAAGVAVVAAVGAALWLGTASERIVPSPPVTTAPVVTPPVPTPSPVAPPLASRDETSRPDGTPVQTPAVAPRARPPASRSARPPAPPVEPASAPGPQPAATSSLAEQLAAYEEARAALGARDFGRAADRFGAFVSRWPDGELADEGRLSQLEALVRAERYGDVVTLAGALADRASLAPRRAEILRALADAYAHTARCDDAARVFTDARAAGGDFAQRDADDAVAACRAAR